MRKGAVQVVEVGVLDNDKSPFSQQVIDNIQASPKIRSRKGLLIRRQA